MKICTLDLRGQKHFLRPSSGSPPVLSFSNHSIYPMARQPSACIRYVYTYNNPVETDEEWFEKHKLWPIKYGIFVREIAPTTGTVHLQGYWEFSKRIRITGIHALPQMGKIAPKVSYGPREKARDYCMKSESRFPGAVPWEYPNAEAFGEVNQAGKRTDLHDVAELIQSGGTLRQVIDQHPVSFIRYSRGISALLSYTSPRRPDPPQVYLFYGPTRCGKSRLARSYDGTNDFWVSPVGAGAQWFDGYCGQSTAIFDDFGGKTSKCGLTDLLQILDRYPVQIPIKGGFVWFNPNIIIITTNIHPKDWYDYSTREEHFEALKERFSAVYHWRIRRTNVHSIYAVGEDDYELFWRGPSQAQRRELGPMDDYVAWIPGDDPYAFM